jgi:Zn-finger protein
MNPIFYILFSEPKEFNLKYNPKLFTNNNSENKNFIQSKRGREKKKKKNKKKTHEKDSKDNIRRKIKTHFFDFIIEHVNKKLKEVNELKQIVFLPI